MKNLTQRAAEAYPFMGDISFMSIATRNQAIASRDGYIRGAVEQRLIDIDRACEWLEDNQVLYANECGVSKRYDWRFIEDFRHFMKSNEEEAV